MGGLWSLVEEIRHSQGMVSIQKWRWLGVRGWAEFGVKQVQPVFSGHRSEVTFSKTAMPLTCPGASLKEELWFPSQYLGSQPKGTHQEWDLQNGSQTMGLSEVGPWGTLALLTKMWSNYWWAWGSRHSYASRVLRLQLLGFWIAEEELCWAVNLARTNQQHKPGDNSK